MMPYPQANENAPSVTSSLRLRRRNRAVQENRRSTISQLQYERIHSVIEWTKSPFHEPQTYEETEEALDIGQESGEKFASRPHELNINVADEVPWIDLLLELAMTTAFASLADNTPILTGQNTYSFVAYSALVWWIWASQVCYNMRFRQADWFHRACAFLQLCVFSGMAAFTNNFDIFDGLESSSDASQAYQIELGLNNTNWDDMKAQQFRATRIPVLNARGISVVMFMSRLLMLSQYFVVFLYAKRFRRSSLVLQLIGISLSALCFLAAYFDIGHNPDVDQQVVKLMLWFGAIIVECATHFGANFLPGHAKYAPEAVQARSATLFIIVLGTGLDKITGSFRYVVGTVGFGAQSVGTLFSVAVIVIGEFTSYFATTGLPHGSNNRLLSWFFFHFFLLASLIVLLQGTVIILAYTNVQHSINLVLDVFNLIFPKIQAGVTLSPDQFPDATTLLMKFGISFKTIIEQMNQSGAVLPPPAAEALVAQAVQSSLQVVLVVLSQFNASPNSGSLLQARVDQFLAPNPDPTKINQAALMTMVQDLLLNRIDPALWYMGAAGGTLILLALLMLIRQWPRDKYEWWSFGSWFASGTLFALLSLFDLQRVGPSFDTLQGKITFRLSSLILPVFAGMLIVQNLISLIISFLARRSARAVRRHHQQQSTMQEHYDYQGQYRAARMSRDLTMLERPIAITAEPSPFLEMEQADYEMEFNPYDNGGSSGSNGSGHGRSGSAGYFAIRPDASPSQLRPLLLRSPGPGTPRR